MTECPYQSTAKSGTSSSKKKPMTNRDWWPDSLNLNVLHQDRKLGELALFFLCISCVIILNLTHWPLEYNIAISARPSHVPHPSTTSLSHNLFSSALYASYAAKFENLDINALRNDIYKSLTTSNPNWPADYGHYGPLIIRLAWHSAGTYRVWVTIQFVYLW